MFPICAIIASVPTFVMMTTRIQLPHRQREEQQRRVPLSLYKDERACKQMVLFISELETIDQKRALLLRRKDFEDALMLSHVLLRLGCYSLVPCSGCLISNGAFFSYSMEAGSIR
jgi:hypothetical protein